MRNILAEEKTYGTETKRSFPCLLIHTSGNQSPQRLLYGVLLVGRLDSHVEQGFPCSTAMQEALQRCVQIARVAQV